MCVPVSWKSAARVGLYLLWVSTGCAFGEKGTPARADSEGADLETGEQEEDSSETGDSADDSGPLLVDLDGDGYTADVDCDDRDAAINPGETEICGDDIDENCNGYSSGCMEGLIALKDANAIISADTFFPDLLLRAPAGDVNGDRIDDLLIAGPIAYWGTPGNVYVFLGGHTFPDVVTSAWLTVEGDPEIDYEFGMGVSSMGDIDGDGMADIAVHSQVANVDRDSDWVVYLFTGLEPGSVTTGEAAAVIVGPEPSTMESGTPDLWQISSDPSDLSGDGLPDLVIGGRYDSRSVHSITWICDAPFTETRTVADCETTIEQDADSSAISGTSADMDGDGMNDLMYGDYLDCLSRDCSSSHAYGAVYVFDGPLAGALSGDDRDQELDGIEAGDWAGYAVASPGDIDGDGYADIAVGAIDANAMYDDGDYVSGAVYIVHGPLSGTTSLAAADATITGDSAHLGLNMNGPGDVNGDGTPDLLVEADWFRSDGYVAGCLALFDGDLTGVNTAATATTRFFPDDDHSFDLVSTPGSGIGDVNNDGTPDLAIGDKIIHDTDHTVTRAYLFWGITP